MKDPHVPFSSGKRILRRAQDDDEALMMTAADAVLRALRALRVLRVRHAQQEEVAERRAPPH